MSRNYSDSTLKKLFSLSGNICAFKSCNSKIIDEFESVIGEISHIEGEKLGSARYNSIPISIYFLIVFYYNPI